MDGNSPRPGRASPLMAPSLLSPPLLSAYHLLIPSSSRSPPAVPASLYEELVDLHETVQSLRQQLHAAEAVEAQHERRAAEAEQRVLPLQLQVQQLTAEVEELRLLCGDVEERKRKRAALEAECREDVRQWRLQREEDFNRRLEERATQRERREKDEEEWRAHSSRQLAAAVSLATITPLPPPHPLHRALIIPSCSVAGGRVRRASAGAGVDVGIEVVLFFLFHLAPFPTSAPCGVDVRCFYRPSHCSGHGQRSSAEATALRHCRSAGARSAAER